MSDEMALLNAIRDDPEDDTVRLAFADWLDEDKQPERAEFIRLQIGKGDLPYAWQYRFEKFGWKNFLDCRWVAEMVSDYGKRNDNKFPGYSWGSSPSPTGPGLYRCGAEEVWVEYKNVVKVTFRRGLLDEVLVGADDFLQYAGEICRDPVRTVRLYDTWAAPIHLSGGCRPPSWQSYSPAGPGYVPQPLFEIMSEQGMWSYGGPGEVLGFDLAKDADYALNCVCLTYGEEQRQKLQKG